jgi:hypothetical protein
MAKLGNEARLLVSAALMDELFDVGYAGTSNIRPREVPGFFLKALDAIRFSGQDFSRRVGAVWDQYRPAKGQGMQLSYLVFQGTV